VTGSDAMTARDLLIEATKRLIWERGVNATSPGAILNASGVGQGSMYHHFSGKPALAAAAAASLAADLQAETDRMLGGAEPSPLAKVRAYLDADRDALRGCRLGRLAFDPGRDDGVAAPIAAYFTGLQRTLAQLLDQAVTAGELVDSTDTTAVATVIVAGVQGGFVLAALTGDPRAMTDTTRGLQALLPRAVTSHAPRPRSQ
jgi:AcrR family transcriptional regulator